MDDILMLDDTEFLIIKEQLFNNTNYNFYDFTLSGNGKKEKN